MSEENNPEDRIIPIDKARKGKQKEKGAEKEEKEEKIPPEELSDRKKAIVEALLFSAESALSPRKLSNLAELDGVKQLRQIVERLNAEYEDQERPYTIENVGRGFRLYTRPEFDPWVSELHESQTQDELSQAALETLAIISYRQPITRAEVEDIRGVQSGYILRSLIEKTLIKVVGRSDELGRPLLYGTTPEFLEAFGLSSIKELPELDDPDLSGGPE